MKALWPQTIVEDNSLNKLMTAVRRALGPGPYVATLQGRGYQFVADVRVSQASPPRPDFGIDARSVASRSGEQQSASRPNLQTL